MIWFIALLSEIQQEQYTCCHSTTYPSAHRLFSLSLDNHAEQFENECDVPFFVYDYHFHKGYFKELTFKLRKQLQSYFWNKGFSFWFVIIVFIETYETWVVQVVQNDASVDDELPSHSAAPDWAVQDCLTDGLFDLGRVGACVAVFSRPPHETDRYVVFDV